MPRRGRLVVAERVAEGVVEQAVLAALILERSVAALVRGCVRVEALAAIDLAAVATARACLLAAGLARVCRAPLLVTAVVVGKVGERSAVSLHPPHNMEAHPRAMLLRSESGCIGRGRLGLRALKSRPARSSIAPRPDRSASVPELPRRAARAWRR